MEPLNFTYYMPTKLLFGAGSLEKLADQQLPGKKALIVIGESGIMRKTGYLGRVEGYLKDAGADSVVFDKIKPNPLASHVDEAAALARSENCDFVVGLGGGSTIDSSKSIAVMAKNPGKYWDYVGNGSGGGKTPTGGALPIIAITTTAGTGTEADPWTVITKSETNEKIGWGNEDTFPTFSIIDPELMLSVPEKQTAYTGMDTFFHSVETYLATVHQPASDHLALEAVGIINENLPKAVKNGQDLEARTQIAWANTAAGICQSLSSCISHHSLEHAVSAYHPEVPHGAGLVMLSVAYFTVLSRKAPERFGELARAMGIDISGMSKEAAAEAFIKALKKLIASVGIADERLADYGVKESEFDNLADNAYYAMGNLFDITPASLKKPDVLEILQMAYSA
ncbi:MAG: iron-containing alcohol dehydrogenase [Spirochaetales bacterium]|nr:iron-containing alcohol dehydrogenase [Spirochaetales bacterium]MCF7938132.1 iron-containing alcohol dehydrogenase [Spirochaetales bacterium]